MEAPRRVLGTTPESISRAFFRPIESAEVVFVENPHGPELPNVRISIRMTGASAELLKATFNDLTIFLSLAIQDPVLLERLELGVPGSREAVGRRLGIPWREDPDRFIYAHDTDMGREFLTIIFSGNDVAGAEWEWVRLP